MGAFVVVLMVILATTSQSSRCQLPDSLWSRTYGGLSNDFWTDCRELSEGDLILTGYTVSPPYRNSQAWLMKTDATGDPVWDQTYGTVGNEHTWSVYPVADGYFLSGFGEYSFWPTVGLERRIFVVRTDLVGEEIWSMRHVIDRESSCHTAIPLQDESLILIGMVGSNSSESDGLVMQLDQNGSVIWQQIYGDSLRNQLWGGVQLDDGGFIFVGSWWLGEPRRFDGWVLRTDAEGNELWHRTYGGSETNDELKGVFVDPDGEIWAGGTYYQYRSNFAQFWLIRLSEFGDSLWARTYGAQRSETCYSIERTVDDGFFMTGSTYSFDDNSPGIAHGWVLRLDQNGDSLWSRTFEDIIWRGRQISDSGFILAGATDAWGAGAADAWLIRMGSELDVGNSSPPIHNPQLSQNYPNPFNATTEIRFDLHHEAIVTLQIYNPLGQLVTTLVNEGRPAGEHRVTWNTADIASGLYIYRLASGGFVDTKKMVLIR